MFINPNTHIFHPNIFILGTKFYDNIIDRTDYILHSMQSKLNLYPITNIRELDLYKDQTPDIIYIAEYIDVSILEETFNRYPNTVIIYEKHKYYEELGDQLSAFDAYAKKIANYIICSSEFLAKTCEGKNTTIIEDGFDIYLLDSELNSHQKDGIVYMSYNHDEYLDYDFINNIISNNPNLKFYFYIDSKLSFNIKKLDNVFFLTPISGPCNIVLELSKYKKGWLPLKDTPNKYSYQLEQCLYMQAKLPTFVKGLYPYNDNMTDDLNNLEALVFNNDLKLNTLHNYLDSIYDFICDIMDAHNIEPFTTLPLIPDTEIEKYEVKIL